MYTKIFLRLEPLGIELIAAELRRAGHEVRLIDLQVEGHGDYLPACSRVAARASWPSRCNYLANVPEVIDLARATKMRSARDVRRSSAATAPRSSPASFSSTPRGRSTACSRARARRRSPGCSRRPPTGDPPALARGPRRRHAGGSRAAARRSVRNLDDLRPARDLLAPSPQVLHRRARPLRVDRVQPGLPLGLLVLQRLDLLRPELPRQVGRGGRRRAGVDPRAGRLHRRRRGVHPGRARHGHRRGDRQPRDQASSTTWRPAATCCLRNKEVFRFWKKLGLQYMFLGVEAIDEEGLKRFRKRVTLSQELRGARVRPVAGDHGGDQPHRRPRLGPPPVRGDPPVVPGDPRDRQHQREHAVPGHRELAHRIAPADHARLPAVRHPARRAADASCRWPSSTASSSGRSKSSIASTWAGRPCKALAGILASNLARGQTNTLKMLWKFNSVYNPELQLADHQQPVRYEMSPPPEHRSPDRPPRRLHPPAQRPPRPVHRRRDRAVRRADSRWRQAIELTGRRQILARGRRFSLAAGKLDRLSYM